VPIDDRKKHRFYRLQKSLDLLEKQIETGNVLATWVCSFWRNWRGRFKWQSETASVCALLKMCPPCFEPRHAAGDHRMPQAMGRDSADRKKTTKGFVCPWR
jgi:hypothetical protein